MTSGHVPLDPDLVLEELSQQLPAAYALKSGLIDLDAPSVESRASLFAWADELSDSEKRCSVGAYLTRRNMAEDALTLGNSVSTDFSGDGEFDTYETETGIKIKTVRLFSGGKNYGALNRFERNEAWLARWLRDTALHEIGHAVGLLSPQEMFGTPRNYKFLKVKGETSDQKTDSSGSHNLLDMYEYRICEPGDLMNPHEVFDVDKCEGNEYLPKSIRPLNLEYLKKVGVMQ